MGKLIEMTVVLVLVALVSAEDQKPQGRQLNWGNLNFGSNSGYSQNYPSSNHGSDPSDLTASPSMLNPQAKASSNFQGLVSQSLDGQDRNDGSYAPSSSYTSNTDYGYEAAPDTSYGNAVGYGYDYQRNLPTPSGRFYSNSDPSMSGNPVIPNTFLRGMPRDQMDHPVPSLSSMQSGRMPYYFQQSGGFYNNSSNVNRAGYDEDTPLGGISSSPSTGSLLSGTTMRSPVSRQDDFSYGTVNGGYNSIPPAATGYGGISYGAGLGGGYGAGYGASSFASPGYSSNYRVPYSGGYSPSYSTAGYSGGYGVPSTYSNSYGSYGNSYSPLYSKYGYAGVGGYGNSYGAGYGGYGNSYGAGYGGGLGYGGGYGAGYGGYGGGFDVYDIDLNHKKHKKGHRDWWKFGKDVMPYGYGSNYAAVPYDYYYDPPGIWHFTKFAMKSMVRSMFKPIFKWLPFCPPYFYKRSDRSDDRQSSFVSALTAFLPIGLFLAAIVPNIVTVSSGRRKRSEAEEAKAAQDEATFPILDMISSFGVRSLQEPTCQSKIVCEIGRMGGLPEANIVQRALWLTANYVPESISNLIGTNKLFRQIRSQQCSEFMCSTD